MSLLERLDLDDPQTTLKHKEIIQQNNYLRRIYLDFYGQFQHCVASLGNDPGKAATVVEIGSGGGFLQAVMPQTITSDVVAGSGIDKVFSALAMPFADGSVDAFVMLNVFHHIHNAEAFLREMQRCLRVGGKVMMIEPANTLFGHFIYSTLHHEPFNPKGDWSFAQGGRLSQANGALPWIVFQRDSEKFARLFPELSILQARPHTPLRYLLSGGLTYRQILPTALYPIIMLAEKLLQPLNRWLGLFMTVELEKKAR